MVFAEHWLRAGFLALDRCFCGWGWIVVFRRIAVRQSAPLVERQCESASGFDAELSPDLKERDLRL
ncbi:hypothetical protein D3C77_610780 [compost metagenome]